jgi:hypothetical protein
VVRNKVSEKDEKTLICKTPDNWRRNPSPAQHSFVKINTEHSQDAVHVYQKLGLCKSPPPTHREGENLVFEPLHKCLISSKHVPPADGNMGVISPVPGPLIARNPSSCNIQFTTGYTIARYLASYVASIDNYNVMRIRPRDDTGTDSTFTVSGELNLNTKITGNRTHLKEQETARSARFPKEKTARAININEPYLMMFGYPPILTNIESVHIPTVSYEERAATERIIPIQALLDKNEELRDKWKQTKALSLHDTIPSHLIRTRQKLPDWRQFTNGQLRKLEDDQQSNLATDKVTIFGFRPPELRFVMNQVNYAKW